MSLTRDTSGSMMLSSPSTISTAMFSSALKLTNIFSTLCRNLLVPCKTVCSSAETTSWCSHNCSRMLNFRRDTSNCSSSWRRYA